MNDIIDTWHDTFEYNLHILDSIDFKPYIDKYKNLRDLRYAIEDDFDHTELTKNDVCEGYIFNLIDEDDLAKYIKDCYGVTYFETTNYIRR